ncbi:MAG: ATP-binding protein [Bacteroidota bacterium]|nr:ATP-binding protein [Bacteroidota bacterium]
MRDRLEISNPGGLPKGLIIKTFGKKAVRRNPVITNLLQRCNYVENMGTGINKIKMQCAENNVEEPNFIFNEFFTVVFKRKFGNKGLNEGLNEGLKSLLQTIIKYPGLQNKGLSEKLNNRPVKTIERQISGLMKLNKVKRKGRKKTGGYYAI